MEWLQEPISNWRWTEEPEMNEREVARYVFGTRVNQWTGAPLSPQPPAAELQDHFRGKMRGDPNRIGYKNAAKLVEAYGMTLDEYRLAHPKAFADISGTEMNKQRALATQEVFTRKGLPNTQDTGPLSTIFQMADIKAPKGTFNASSRRKTRGKARRKTRKQTRRRA